MIEIWKPIPNYEGIYSVSNLARIRNEIARNKWKSGRILKQCVDSRGYLQVNLYKEKRETKLVAHIVAHVFVGPEPKGMEINHKDGNKFNNLPDNLEYTTRSGNMKHAYRHGLVKLPSEIKRCATFPR